MFKPIELNNELSKEKRRLISDADELVLEANKILVEEKFTEKNILNNLKSYHKSFGLVDEVGVNKENLFTIREIRSICIKYRLRFTNSDAFEGDFPYESILKIKDLNTLQRKDLKYFKIIIAPEKIKDPSLDMDTLLFAETVYGNYYLIHRWGKSIARGRKWKYFPVRNIETMMLFTLLISVFFTMALPNNLISTDKRADYFSMYRVACLFHMLILDTGFMVFYMIKKKISFSFSSWNSSTP